MSFSKSFPRTVKGSPYPRWEEVFISEEEERSEEDKCRVENLRIMDQCIEDAKKIMANKSLKPYQTDLVNTAIAVAGNPSKMAEAFCIAVQAGRMAYEAKLGPQLKHAEASSPLTAFLQ